MRLSLFIEILEERKASYGDVEVFIDPSDGSGLLYRIEDVDMCSEDTGLIIWCGDSITMEDSA